MINVTVQNISEIHIQLQKMDILTIFTLFAYVFINEVTVSAESPYPSWPADFFWSDWGRLSGYRCLHTNEPSTKEFDDNYLCWKGNKDLGFRWSWRYPIANMRCTLINDPIGQQYRDNYLCVPRSSPYHFSWSWRDPIKGRRCINFHENVPGWADNFLCAMPTQNNFPDPVFPDDFKWSSGGIPKGYDCIHIYDPAQKWNWDDNYLCWKERTKNPGIRWSHVNPIPNMRCTKFSETTKGWFDNYLCVPKSSKLRWNWFENGAPQGYNCLQIDEPAEGGWDNNYLCGEKCTLKKIEISEKADLTGEYQGAQIIGVVSGGSCLGSGEHTLTITSVDSVVESVGMELSETDEINWSLSTSVEVEASVNFIFAKTEFDVGVETSVGGSHSYGKSESKEFSEGHDSGVGQTSTYTTPGAAILFGMVDRYKIDNAETPITMHFQCPSGVSFAKESTMKLHATTYQTAHFESMIGEFNKSACAANEDLPRCVREIPYGFHNYFGDMQNVRNAFRECFDDEKGTISK